MSPGWHRLAAFWAAVLLMSAGGAGALQVLGPIEPMEPKPILASTEPPPAAKPKPPAEAIRPQAAPPEAAAPVPHAGALIHPPDVALLEPAPSFPGRFLPRRAADLRSSMGYYARPNDPTDRRPAVAILVVGLGQAEGDSLAASATLPGEVSLGFSPYALNPDPLLVDAREHGHEYFVTLPMESQGYPLNDSGPHALLTGADLVVNDRNLEWILSRMHGEVGVTGASDGLRGERFASATSLLNGVLSTLSARGLMYVDPRPGAAIRPGVVVASLVLDDPADRTSIDAKLAQLEQRARDGEMVLGLAGPPRPVMVERVAAWAKGLDARGVHLVPVSALLAAK